MGELAYYVLDVLGELGGGRGEKINDLPRFALGIILWTFLWFSVWRVRQQNPQPRESLMLIGITVGLAREWFMFTIQSLKLYGILPAETLELFFPPLEHTFMVVTRVFIAAAFLQYLLDSRLLARRFLLYGAIAAGVFYFVASPIWWAAVEADPAIRFSKFWGDWVVHSLGAVLSVIVIVLFIRAGGWLKLVVSVAFAFYFFDDFLMLINLATDEVYKSSFTPIRHNLHIWAIPLFGYVYWREQYDEHERLQVQLRRTERIDALGQLAAGVAHDINNHLQVIVGYTELVRDKTADLDSVQQSLGHITRASDSAGGLINQLLSLSRDDEVHLTNVDLNNVVAELGPMISRLMGSEVRVKYELEPDVPRVYADKNMLEQIVVNLIVNARDAMPDGGTILLQTTAYTVISASRDKTADATKGAQLIVTDTGVGMDEETLDHAFEPFFTTKPIGQGTGLGLAMIHSVVQKQNGQIAIKSKPGQGTTVIVDFPATAAKNEQESETSIPLNPGGNETILLAEDEYPIRDLALELLQSAGYTVLVACDGQEAIEIAENTQESIDLLVLDVAMPNTDGYQAFDAIQKRRTNVPVLFITGDSSRPVKRRSDLPHLIKPFNRTSLLNRVREQLDATRS